MSYLREQTEALLFQLKHGAGLDGLALHELFAQAEDATVKALLESAMEFANDQLVPLAASGDRDGCRLLNGQVALPPGSREIYKQWCELGFPALGLPVAIEGLGLPRTVQSAVQELCDGDDPVRVCAPSSNDDDGAVKLRGTCESSALPLSGSNTNHISRTANQAQMWPSA